MLAALCRSRTPDGDLDLEVVVDRIARGEPVRHLPRTARATNRRGVQVLLDFGDGMRPFVQDQDEACAALERIAGPDGFEVLRFAGTPLDDPGAGPGPVWTWRPYAPPAGHRPVLVLSDLGAGADPLERPALQLRWTRFARLVRACRQPGGGAGPGASAAPAARAAGGAARGHLGPGHPGRGRRPRGEPTAVEGAMTTPDAVRRRIERLRATNAAAADLATLLSTAVRIEPALVRRMRLLLPRADVGAELDLWGSDVVASASPLAMSLEPACAEALRGDLAGTAYAELRERAADVVEEVHAGLHWSLRLEERINRLMVRGDARSAQEAEGLLFAAIAELRATAAAGPTAAVEATGLARWLLAALGRIPRALAGTEAAVVAGLGAGTQLDGRFDPASEASSATEAWMPWLLSAAAVEPRTVSARFSDGSLTLNEPGPGEVTLRGARHRPHGPRRHLARRHRGTPRAVALPPGRARRPARRRGRGDPPGAHRASAGGWPGRGSRRPSSRASTSRRCGRACGRASVAAARRTSSSSSSTRSSASWRSRASRGSARARWPAPPSTRWTASATSSPSTSTACGRAGTSPRSWPRRWRPSCVPRSARPWTPPARRPRSGTPAIGHGATPGAARGEHPIR